MDFDKLARGWDTPDRVRAASTLAQRVVSSWEGERPHRLLDFGCGTGVLALALSASVDQVVGVDASREMRAVLAEKLAEGGVTNVTVEDGLDGMPAQFDAVVSSMAFHHVADVPQTLRVIASTMVPGARLAIVDLDPDGGVFHAGIPNFDGHNGFDRDEFSSELVAAGFHGVEMADYSRGTRHLGERDVEYSQFIVTARR